MLVQFYAVTLGDRFAVNVSRLHAADAVLTLGASSTRHLRRGVTGVPGVTDGVGRVKLNNVKP